MAPDILDGGDDVAPKIEIDRDYARRLEHNKRREALHRYEDQKKRGLVPASSGESSSDESSDGGDPAGSRRSHLQLFDALLKVKRGDPSIYQKDTRLFSSSSDEDSEEETRTASKKEKPLYLKDVMAKQLMEGGPELEEENPFQYGARIYIKEQAEDIKSILKAKGEDGDDGSDGDIFTAKEGVGELKKDEDDTAGEMKQKIDDYFGDDEKLDEGDMLLKKFFLEELWADNDNDIQYKELEVGVSEDEDVLDMQDRYESEFNFRHQELGAADAGDRIWGHSRVTEGSVRKKMSRHKVQRESKKERLALLKREQDEELKQLKNLKKKEIQEKINRIRKAAGIREGAACNLNEDDFEEDFDSKKHDKMMEMYGEKYCDAEDADSEFGSDHNGELEKPDFDKEDELLATFGVSLEAKDEPRTTEVKKKKKKHKIFLQEKIVLQKELEEHDKLNYEGTIEDLKTRYKYRSVQPNRYGLTPDEIACNEEKVLNQYVSVKKMAPYRQQEWKVTFHQKQKKDMILQGKDLDSKKLKKKHMLKEALRSTSASKITELEEMHGGDKVLDLQDVEGEDANVTSKKNRRKRRRADLKLSHSRLAAYGKIPSKSSKKHK